MNTKLYHTAPVRALTSRLYETEHDLQQMQIMLMEARSHTNDWHYAHVGELMWGFFMVVCHLNPQEYIRLWHDDEGKLVGYAILGEDPSFDCQVLPEYEWSGIEAEARRATLERQARFRRSAGRCQTHRVSGAARFPLQWRVRRGQHAALVGRADTRISVAHRLPGPGSG
jgi:hypothetical protein